MRRAEIRNAVLAWASFAFGRDVAAVDANVRRVVRRLHGVATGEQALADALVPRGRAAEWNQAMIDLGAEVCRARAPRCETCPVQRMCRWRGDDVRPARTPPRFETTTRYARGRIVGALRSSASLSVPAIARVTGLSRERVTDALGTLEHDGLVHRRGRAYRLGPSARA